MAKKKNSKAINIQDLPPAKSRVEEYLDFLCGRATVLANLPKPQSRVEHFLEYLCHNGGIGGGGQAPTNAFVNATIQGNKITFQRQDGTTHEVNLDDIIPNATKESIKEIRVDGKELVLTKVDNQETRVDLTQLLSASNISFNNANSGLTSDNVQGAIDELNGKFIEDITFDTTIDNVTNKPKNTLKKTKNGQPTDVVNHVVTEWQDLEHVEKFTTTNLVDFSKRQNGVKFDSTGQNVINGANNGLVKFNVVAGEEYTLIRQRANHGRIRFDNENGGFVSFLDEQMRIYNRWNRLKFTAPPGSTVATLELLVSQDNEKEVMVLQGDQLNLAIDTTKPIPYSDNALIQIGTEVSHKFDNSNSSLLSTTVESAIKELDGKSIKSVNTIQPVDGNITINASHIEYDKTQSQIQADTIQQAIDMLKRDVDLLPTASIYIVPNKQELDDLLGRNVLNHGDLVYVIDSTGVVDYTGQLVDGGNPVAMIYDTSLSDTTNRLRVFSKFGSGAINVTASTVAYDDNVTNLGATNVQKAVEQLNNKIVNAGTVKSINSLTPQVDGDVELTSQVTQNVGQDIVLRVGNRDFATLECMTDQEADEIIDGFTF